MSSVNASSQNSVCAVGSANASVFPFVSMGDAALTITPTQANIVVGVPALTAGRTLTLPHPSLCPGMRVTVLLTATIAQILTITAGANLISGTYAQPGADYANLLVNSGRSSAATSLTAAATGLAGDRAELISTGSIWSAQAYSAVETNNPTWAFA